MGVRGFSMPWNVPNFQVFPMFFKVIPRQQRVRVRQFARRCFEDGRGDKEAALALAEERRDMLGSIVTSILVSLAAKLAVKLIVYWIEQKFRSVPDGDFVRGEPGA